MKIKDLTMEKPFKGLFPIAQDTIAAIRKDMEDNKYDLSRPVVIWPWQGRNIVIDGNTRILAAKLAGLETVPVDTKDFKDEHEALQYAIHNQRDRRNMTDADILRYIEAVDKRKKSGERTDLASLEAKSGKSAKETAEIIGTSTTKVEKARTILDHADEKTKQEVSEGKKTIHKAAKETRHAQKGLLNTIDELISLCKPAEETMNDFHALRNQWDSIHKLVVKFQLRHSYKKREWKAFLPEIHKWTSNLNCLTEIWMKQLEKKPQEKGQA